MKSCRPDCHLSSDRKRKFGDLDAKWSATPLHLVAIAFPTHTRADDTQTTRSTRQRQLDTAGCDRAAPEKAREGEGDVMRRSSPTSKNGCQQRRQTAADKQDTAQPQLQSAMALTPKPCCARSSLTPIEVDRLHQSHPRVCVCWFVHVPDCFFGSPPCPLLLWKPHFQLLCIDIPLTSRDPASLPPRPKDSHKSPASSLACFMASCVLSVSRSVRQR